MKISEFLNDRKRLDIAVKSSAGEAEFYIVYKPNAWNYKSEKALEGLEGFERMAVNLVMILADWDLTDDKDVKIPITVEAMKVNGLPHSLLRTIIRAINDDMYGDKETKNA